MNRSTSGNGPLHLKRYGIAQHPVCIDPITSWQHASSIHRWQSRRESAPPDSSEPKIRKKYCVCSVHDYDEQGRWVKQPATCNDGGRVMIVISSSPLSSMFDESYPMTINGSIGGIISQFGHWRQAIYVSLSSACLNFR